MKTKPLIGITMGDPSGVGPEIILRGLAGRKIRSTCRPLIIGQASVLRERAKEVADKVKLVPVSSPHDATPPGTYALLEAGKASARLRCGRATAAGGRSSLASIERAVQLAIDGKVDAIVTAPISKEAIRKAGSSFPGHTEMLAALTGAEKYAMMLVGGGLRVSLATIHIPLRDVPLALTRAGIFQIIRLTWEALPGFGAGGGKIAVCGLNPHAGEAGIMGDEDGRIIAPAIRSAVRKGINVSGPHPADTVFHRALRGEFEAVVAMYHDQGLVPLKTHAFDSGVNLTLGLPIIRTSVDHGTAYDIAGKGIASPESLIAAVTVAADLARHRPDGS